jgi:hypothetical protein
MAPDLLPSASETVIATCPGPLQQMLFETAEALAGPRPPRPAKLVSLTTA